MLQSLTNINYKTFSINLLFSFIPISFLAGNLILNINILLFIVLGIFFYGKDIFNLNFNNLDKLIIVFFTYTIFTGILNNFYFKSESLNEDFTIITKSLLYIRFLFLYLVIRILIKNELINFKLFYFLFYLRLFCCS